MKLKFQEHSELKLVSWISETQFSEAKRPETCWTNYPVCEAYSGIPIAQRIGIDRYTPWKEMMNNDLEPLNRANNRNAYALGEFAIRP
jgi:hypothetical protein